MAREIGVAPSIGVWALQTGWARLRRNDSGSLERWLEAERDQLPLWLPVALGCGIAAWFVLPGPASWIAALLAALALAAAGFAVPEGRRAGQALRWFGIAAGLGLCLIWGRAEAVRAPVLDRPLVATFEGRVDRFERLRAREAIRLTLAVEGAELLPRRLRVNVADDDLPTAVTVGARVRVRARLMPPAPSAVPDAYNFARRAWFDRIGATGRALGTLQVTAPAPGSFGSWIGGARTGLTDHVQARLAGSAGGVAASLVTGDQGGISEADADALRGSGLAHLLSISGLHISAAVAGTMFLVMRLLALSPRLALHWPLPLIAAAAGAAAGVVYTLLSGGEVPAVRACIAALLVLAGMALGPDALTLRLVAVGALVVLLLWPDSLVSASFQLSFAAVASIVALHEHPRVQALLARREEDQARRFLRLLLSLLLTGLVVEAALAPIALFHFHRTGLYGAFANIVAIPLTTFVIMPLAAAGLLLDLGGAGAPFWWLTEKAIGLLLLIAHQAASAPGAVAALPTMPVSTFALMIAGGVWIALWRTQWRAFGFAPLLIGAVLAISVDAPHMLVTGDGTHMALRGPHGLVLLRPRAGDYIRDTFVETAGEVGAATDIDSLPGARCGPDLCNIRYFAGGRQWQILATRSRYFVEIDAMRRACAAADIVVSDRRLPAGCRPRWLKLDRPALVRTGGLSIDLATTTVDTVVGDAKHPWLRSADPSSRPVRQQPCCQYRRSNPASLPCTCT